VKKATVHEAATLAAQKITARLTGLTVNKVRFMPPQECEENGWFEHSFPMILVLGDGTEIVALQDEEGNGPGWMNILDKDGTDLTLDAWGKAWTELKAKEGK